MILSYLPSPSAVASVAAVAASPDGIIGMSSYKDDQSLSEQSRVNTEGCPQPFERAIVKPCIRLSALADNCPNEDDAFCPQSQNSAVKGEWLS